MNDSCCGEKKGTLAISRWHRREENSYLFVFVECSENLSGIKEVRIVKDPDKVELARAEGERKKE